MNDKGSKVFEEDEIIMRLHKYNNNLEDGIMVPANMLHYKDGGFYSDLFYYLKNFIVNMYSIKELNDDNIDKDHSDYKLFHNLLYEYIDGFIVKGINIILINNDIDGIILWNNIYMKIFKYVNNKENALLRSTTFNHIIYKNIKNIIINYNININYISNDNYTILLNILHNYDGVCAYVYDDTNNCYYGDYYVDKHLIKILELFLYCDFNLSNHIIDRKSLTALHIYCAWSTVQHDNETERKVIDFLINELKCDPLIKNSDGDLCTEMVYNLERNIDNDGNIKKVLTSESGFDVTFRCNYIQKYIDNYPKKK